MGAEGQKSVTKAKVFNASEERPEGGREEERNSRKSPVLTNCANFDLRRNRRVSASCVRDAA